MSVVRADSLSGGNATDEQHDGFTFPRDVDFHLLHLYRNINFGISLFGFHLAVLMVITCIKSLRELRRKSKCASDTTAENNWIMRKLRSKPAPIVIICANGVTLILGQGLGFILYFDVGGEVLCDVGQRLLTVSYVLGLWTTYVLFEIRRMATGTDTLTGIRYWIMQSVRLGTMSIPFFSIFAYHFAAGIYISDIRHCVLELDAAVSVLFGVADGLLSIVSMILLDVILYIYMRAYPLIQVRIAFSLRRGS
jgi:hypothetical protein